MEGAAGPGDEGAESAPEDRRLEGREATSEAGEVTVEEVTVENGLSEQIDAIKWESSDALFLRDEEREARLTEEAILNELSSPIRRNQEAGERRENEEHEELERKYPPEDGYRIFRQLTLCDEKGDRVADPVTGEGRRPDFAVVKDGEVIKSVEVTSLEAGKNKQMEKEDRIREAGGNYVKTPTGEVVPFGAGVNTEVKRRP